MAFLSASDKAGDLTLTFYGATELELISDKDVLEFQREYILGKEPMRMDLLIIKKLADVRIESKR